MNLYRYIIFLLLIYSSSVNFVYASPHATLELAKKYANNQANRSEIDSVFFKKFIEIKDVDTLLNDLGIINKIKNNEDLFLKKHEVKLILYLLCIRSKNDSCREEFQFNILSYKNNDQLSDPVGRYLLDEYIVQEYVRNNGINLTNKNEFLTLFSIFKNELKINKSLENIFHIELATTNFYSEDDVDKFRSLEKFNILKKYINDKVSSNEDPDLILIILEEGVKGKDVFHLNQLEEAYLYFLNGFKVEQKNYLRQFLVLNSIMLDLKGKGWPFKLKIKEYLYKLNILVKACNKNISDDCLHIESIYKMTDLILNRNLLSEFEYQKKLLEISKSSKDLNEQNLIGFFVAENLVNFFEHGRAVENMDFSKAKTLQDRILTNMDKYITTFQLLNASVKFELKILHSKVEIGDIDNAKERAEKTLKHLNILYTGLTENEKVINLSKYEDASQELDSFINKINIAKKSKSIELQRTNSDIGKDVWLNRYDKDVISIVRSSNYSYELGQYQEALKEINLAIKTYQNNPFDEIHVNLFSEFLLLKRKIILNKINNKKHDNSKDELKSTLLLYGASIVSVYNQKDTFSESKLFWFNFEKTYPTLAILNSKQYLNYIANTSEAFKNKGLKEIADTYVESNQDNIRAIASYYVKYGKTIAAIQSLQILKEIDHSIYLRSQIVKGSSQVYYDNNENKFLSTIKSIQGEAFILWKSYALTTNKSEKIKIQSRFNDLQDEILNEITKFIDSSNPSINKSDSQIISNLKFSKNPEIYFNVGLKSVEIYGSYNSRYVFKK